MAHPKGESYERTQGWIYEYESGGEIQTARCIVERDCTLVMKKLLKEILKELSPRFADIKIQVHDFCTTTPRCGHELDGEQLANSMLETNEIRSTFFDAKAINIDVTTYKIQNMLMVKCLFDLSDCADRLWARRLLMKVCYGL